MEKPVLKKVNILVYPFHELNKALETPEGIAKFVQWTKQIEYAGKNKDSAFIIIHDSFSKDNIFRQRFESFLRKELGERYVTVNSGVGGLSRLELIDFFKMVDKNFSISKKIEVRRFGQYVPDASVEKVGLPISHQIKRVLERAGVLTSEKIVNGLSVKQPDAYFAKMILKKLKLNPKFSDELYLRVLSNSIRANGKVSPVLVAHAIKRSKSLDEVHKNLGALKTRVRK